jgi:hypothetical protein
MGRRGGGERDFIGKLIHARVANHYDSEAWDNLCATVHSKSSYLKIIKVQG